MLTTILPLFTSVTVFFVTVLARPFPYNLPPLLPPPGRDLPSLWPPFFYPETRSPPPLSMPNVTPPPVRGLPSLQPLFFFPKTRSLPPPSMPKPTPPLNRDLPPMQPPYLEKDTPLPPASGSIFILKLIIAAGISAAILVLLLVLSKCRGLPPETTIQAVGLGVTVMTC